MEWPLRMFSLPAQYSEGDTLFQENLELMCDSMVMSEHSVSRIAACKIKVKIDVP